MVSELRQKVNELIEQGVNVYEVADVLGCNLSTVYRYAEGRHKKTYKSYKFSEEENEHILQMFRDKKPYREISREFGFANCSSCRLYIMRLLCVSQPKKGKKPQFSESKQLCWTCQNAVGRCDWGKNLTPVEGWTATKGKQEGWCSITACPQYIPDEVTEDE